jgi:hypothetical protein
VKLSGSCREAVGKLSGSWTDPAAPVNMTRFAGLINRAAELAAPTR